MGPLGDASAALPSSPGRTRTYNPSVNSRMLCRLSYRGRLRGRLYGPSVGASRFGRDSAQGGLEGLYFSLKRIFLVVVWGFSLAALAAQDAEAQPGFPYGGFGSVESLAFRGESADPVHQRAGSLVGEYGAQVLPRVLSQQGEDARVGFVAEVFGEKHKGLGQRRSPHSPLERFSG